MLRSNFSTMRVSRPDRILTMYNPLALLGSDRVQDRVLAAISEDRETYEILIELVYRQLCSTLDFYQAPPGTCDEQRRRARILVRRLLHKAIIRRRSR